MAKALTDREVVEGLGERLLAAGYTEVALKKWKQKKRGIPWRERGHVAELAARAGIELPADFAKERRFA